MLWLFLIGCQEPFGAGRHDLVGDRIAAVEVEVADGVVRPRAALVTEGRLWSDAPPALEWFFVAEADDLPELEAAPEAVAATPELTLGSDSVLGLRVTWHDGTRRHATLDLDAIARVGARPAGITASGLAVDLDDETLDLGLAARRSLQAAHGQLGGDEELVRLTAEGLSADDTVRWMATAGTFLELDAHATDWAPGQLVLDDEHVDTWHPEELDVVTFLALSLGDGAGRFTAADLWLREPAEAGTWVGGRWLPGVSVAEPSWVELAADDAAPSGLRIDTVVASPEVPPQASCAEDALDLDVLLTGRCARRDLVGVAVWLEPDP